jgi:16S rRNA (cytosine967-C5)-methyltransferase
MRSEQQLRTFLRVLGSYQEDRPLAKFLPEFFRRNKQMGSNDRRSASRLLYNYYRIGKALMKRPIEERLFFAEFLCTSVDNPFLQHFRPELNEKIYLSPEEKINYLSKEEGFNIKDVFPSGVLSSGIEESDFLRSLFVQPDLFIRIYPGKEELVISEISSNAIPYTRIGEHTLALPNGTNLDRIFPDATFPLKPYEVQDLSSQRTLKYFQPQPYEHWWDACAASGGKSLLLFSEQPDIKLIVSDIRESVLENLDERFINAGMRTYQKKVLDLTQNPDQLLHHYEFDGIILDAPCSGSGTWGRTPEMISQFVPEKLQGFQKLQRAIASNVIKYLKPGKPLIYITCSVFKQENEDVVDYLIREYKLELVAQEIFSGYEQKADTMFAARLIKPLSNN